MLDVIDHTEPNWLNLYLQKDRENGASTYSKDIIKYQVPVWKEYTKNLKGVISTCPLLVNCQIKLCGDLAVQYFHTYPYLEPLQQAKEVSYALRGYNRIIFVTTYRAQHLQLSSAGFESMWIPMTIEPVAPTEYLKPIEGKHAAYWGNITRPKTALFDLLEYEFAQEGWELHHVKGSQKSSWKELTKYTYGVGVGRCALEMLSLELKVMIAGSKFGGLITNEEEYKIQSYSNFNGRVITFDRSILACLRAWSLSEVRFQSGPEVAVEALHKHLRSITW